VGFFILNLVDNWLSVIAAACGLFYLGEQLAFCYRDGLGFFGLGG